MTRAYDYYKKYSMPELIAMQERITSDPRNKNPNGGIWLYKPSANKRLDDITWAITWKIKENKENNDQH
jgi:hypothetical protein